MHLPQQQRAVGGQGAHLRGGAGAAVPAARRSRRRAYVTCAGLGDAFKDLFDFESWAPKSSQAWRLGNGTGDKPQRAGAWRVARVARAGKPTRAAGRAAWRSSHPPASTHPLDLPPPKNTHTGGAERLDAEALSRLAEAAAERAEALPLDPPSEQQQLEQPAAASAQQQQQQEEEQEELPSFLQSSDEELASALNDRITQMAAEPAPGGGGGTGEAGAPEPLTGPRLRELVLQKWGKQVCVGVRERGGRGSARAWVWPQLNVNLLHAPRPPLQNHQYDLAFVRRDLPLGGTLVCLNVMWVHLEQRSFPMTEAEYDEKMDLVAYYLK